MYVPAECVRILLNKGVSLRSSFALGCPPLPCLLYCVVNDQVEMAKLLVKAGHCLHPFPRVARADNRFFFVSYPEFVVDKGAQWRWLAEAAAGAKIVSECKVCGFAGEEAFKRDVLAMRDHKYDFNADVARCSNPGALLFDCWLFIR